LYFQSVIKILSSKLILISKVEVF